uniref:RING-type domain-containing protein n=2 Tax=Solanum lycopersicum TaxID=4081 RepID=A0A494G928_SOLLC
VRIDAKNKRKMEEMKEEPSSVAVSQQKRTTPANRLPLKPSLQKFCPTPSSFNFNTQQQMQPLTEPENVEVLLKRPFTSFTALLTEEDDDSVVPGSIRHMYDSVDQVIESHSGQVKNMLIDIYMRHFNSISSAANREAEKKLVEKEEELRQAKMRIMELENKVNLLTNHCRKLQNKVASLDVRCAVLDSRLYAAYHLEAQMKQESVESSHVDPHVVELPPPTMVEPPPSVGGNCYACRKNAASIIWPCGHFRVCATCASHLRACPDCHTPKNTVG